jgi:hypothetical protein
VPAPQQAPEPAPAPGAAPPQPPASRQAAAPAASTCGADADELLAQLLRSCELARALAPNSIAELVSRYHLLTRQYQPEIAVTIPGIDTVATIPALDVIPTHDSLAVDLPDLVVELPEAALQPVVGLLSPQPAPRALPSAVRELDPLRSLPPRRAGATAARPAARASPPQAPLAVATSTSARPRPLAAARAAPAAHRPEARPTQPRPEPPAPLDARRAGAGAAPGGASASAGGSFPGAGAVIASLVLLVALAVLDLLRRLRLEPAVLRSEHVDSFPERPG